MGQFSQDQSNSYALRSIERNLRDIYNKFGPDLSKVKSEHALKSYHAVEAKYVANGGDLEALKKSYEPKVIQFSEAKEKEVNEFLDKEKKKWTEEDKIALPSELTTLNRKRVELNLGYPKHLVTRKDETPEAYKERRNQLDAVNKRITELEKSESAPSIPRPDYAQALNSARAHARTVQDNADKANGIVRSNSGNGDLQRANDRRMEASDRIADIWIAAAEKGYSSASGSTGAAVASSSSYRSDGPAYVPGQGFRFEEGQAASMNRDREAYITSNASGRAEGFERIIAARDAQEAALHLAHQTTHRAEFAERAERHRAIIAEHLDRDPSGESLAEVKNLHYIAKNGDRVRGSARVVMARLEKDFPDEYEGVTESLTGLQKRRVELAATEKKNNFLNLRAENPGALGNKEFVALKSDLDKINASIVKHALYNNEANPRIQRKHELSSREKRELTKICGKYGYPANEEGVKQVALIINTRLGVTKPASDTKPAIPERQANAGVPTNAINIVAASNQEAAAVSLETFAKAGANLSNLLGDAFSSLKMPPLPANPALLNAGQYQTASLSAPSQATGVEQNKITEENGKLYAAHSLALQKGQSLDPRNFNIPQNESQLREAKKFMEATIEATINDPALSELNKAEYKKFVAFLDQAIEMKGTKPVNTPSFTS